MKRAFSSILSAVIAITLISWTAMGPGAVSGSTIAEQSTNPIPAISSLDGKKFLTRSGEKGKPASKEDTFVFRNGRFLSESCTPYGFKDAPYQANVDHDAIRFRSVTHSPTHGTMVWDGIVKGDAIEATSVWTRERWYWNIKREFWFRGELQK